MPFSRWRMSAMWHMSLAVGRRIGVEWDGVVGRRGVGSVGNNRDERHGKSGRRSRSRFANNLDAGEFGWAIDRDIEVELAFNGPRAMEEELSWDRQFDKLFPFIEKYLTRIGKVA